MRATGAKGGQVPAETKIAGRRRPALSIACGVRRPGRRLRRAVRWHELHGDAVHAVALAGTERAVVEHVAEMAAATPAMHLGAQHEQRAVVRRADRIGERRVKARPAGAALKLGVGGEQRKLAGGTDESALALLGIERAGIRPLGAL